MKEHWQFPFPNYENGDIFLLWGSIGVEAYVNYKPEPALKYIENILARYENDGLAFQRYGRLKQDVSSSASTGETYRNETDHDFRGDKLSISLEKGSYSNSINQFKLTSSKDFGFNAGRNEREYFNSNSSKNGRLEFEANVKTDPSEIRIRLK